MIKTDCILCKSRVVSSYLKTSNPFNAHYYKCSECDLVFLDNDNRLSLEQEKERYLQHENTYTNSGFVKFLQLLTDPMLNYIDESDIGLDYGSGPTAVLEKVFAKMDIHIENFDPIFSPIKLSRKYDFIVSTEVFEHFYNPFDSISHLLSYLENQGILGIMTAPLTEDIDFESWYYRRDPTHVSFYSEKTMLRLEAMFRLKRLYHKDRVFIWQRA